MLFPCFYSAVLLPSNDHLRHSIQKSGLSKFCGRQPSKNLNGYGLLQPLSNFKFLKGCLPEKKIFSTVEYFVPIIQLTSGCNFEARKILKPLIKRTTTAK